MNKVLFFLILFFSFGNYAQKNFKIITENNSKIVIEITDSKEMNFISKQLANESYIDFSKTREIVSLEKNKPQLPLESKSIILPFKGNPSFNVISQEEEIITNVSVLPSKGNLKRNINPENVAYEFGQVYSENNYFPENTVNLKTPFNLRTLRGQVIQFSPYQFNPVTKTLRHIKKIVIEISFNTNQIGQNELNLNEINPLDANQFGGNFLNKPLLSKYAQIEEDGDLLVVAPTSYQDTLNTLINWKKQKGISTKLITIAETNVTSLIVKNLIQAEFQSNPNIRYVLLIGDHQQIPAYSYGMSLDNEELSSDSYYGQLSGNDYYPEVFVGRFSGTPSDVSTMVQRTMEYETNPKEGDWMTKALGLASGQGAGYGDDEQADWQHLRAIRTQLADFGYTSVSEFYEGSRGQGDAAGNPTSAIILPVVNAGIGLFNYTGHGDLNTCITGNFGSTQINQGTNNGMYPFVISVACNNGTFTYGNCISETWLKAKENNTPSGAIAACGSSILMAWAPPMQTQDGMTDLIVQTDANNIKQTLGGLFYNGQMSMLEKYPDEGIEVMQTWVFFGDPSVDFRNKVTQDLAVKFDTCYLRLDEQDFTFTSSENDVLVSLTQNDSLIAKSRIQNNSLTFSLSGIDFNTPITVVCSKPNFKPQIEKITFKDDCTVTPISSELKIYPSPASDKLILDLGQMSTNLSYKIYDLTGKVVLNYSNSLLNANSEFIDIKSLANGLYTIVLSANELESTLKFVVFK
ncbi:MAG: C25 family cysteine peptidase [Flavobacteriia bacterium]|jgi:gingipain R